MEEKDTSKKEKKSKVISLFDSVKPCDEKPSQNNGINALESPQKSTPVNVPIPTLTELEENEVLILDILKRTTREATQSLEFLFQFASFISSLKNDTPQNKDSTLFLNTFKFMSLLFDRQISDIPTHTAIMLKNDWEKKFGPVNPQEIEQVYIHLSRKNIRAIQTAPTIELTSIGIEIWKWVKKILAYETRKEQLGILAKIFEGEHEFREYLLFSDENIDIEGLKNYIMSLKSAIKEIRPRIYEITANDDTKKIMAEIKIIYQNVQQRTNFKYMDADLREKVLKVSLDTVKLIYEILPQDLQEERIRLSEGQRSYIWNQLDEFILQTLKDKESVFLENLHAKNNRLVPIKLSTIVEKKAIVKAFSRVLDSEYKDPDVLADIEMIQTVQGTLSEIPKNIQDDFDLIKDQILDKIPLHKTVFESTIVVTPSVESTLNNMFGVSALLEKAFIEYTGKAEIELSHKFIKTFFDGIVQKKSEKK